MTGIETSHDKMKTPSGHLGKHQCLEVGGFDVGGGVWVPIIHQHRGIPVYEKNALEWISIAKFDALRLLVNFESLSKT